MARAARLLAAALAASLLGGCSTVGTRTLPMDRFDFTESVSRSWREQILLNIVKARYGEVPTFVEVAQIVTGYEARSEVRVSGDFNLYNPTDFFGAGGTASWVDRPTLTYSPLTGEKFTRVILVPIPSSAILLLLQAGYRADLVMDTLVQSVNGHVNPRSPVASAASAASRFPRIVELLKRIQAAGGLDFRVDPGEKDAKPMTLMVLRSAEVPGASAEVEELRSILGIPPDRIEVPLVNGVLPGRNGEVTMFCHSTLQVLLAMGNGVEVPPDHVEAGWAFPARPGPPMPDDYRLRVRSGDSPPGDALVSVRHLGRWFWVSQDDLASKRALVVLGLMLRALETGEGGKAPILSISTN
ncbi:MAG: hypothetical protein HUU06_11505 [Planctomycetaceae bacterium]|nr:hypothetical protein [Planctomycetota bacterium]NUN53396.1 hypothetical protein [Planctomycetaceae bacterium]